MHVQSLLASTLMVLATGQSALAAPSSSSMPFDESHPSVKMAREMAARHLERESKLQSRDEPTFDFGAYGGRNTVPPGTCKNPIVRKEWRSLNALEKLSFIAAVMCMQLIPSKTGGTYKGAKSRYDDYQALHIKQTDYIHFNGYFQPYHRYMLHMFETDLRKTCGYTGGIPFWDWRIDADKGVDKVLQSPVFDKILGFGGNGKYIADVSTFPAEWQAPMPIQGRQGGGCVTSGPFAWRPIPMGPGNHTEFTPHCLRRDVSPLLITRATNSARVAWVLSADNYWDFEHRTEGVTLGWDDVATHGGGHLGVGGQIGEMTNTYSSPGDPLFWLHHAMIDNLWDQWQRVDFASRKLDINGPDTSFAYPWNLFGDVPYQNVTLEHEMPYPLMANTLKIGDVMDTQAGPFCYTYQR